MATNEICVTLTAISIGVSGSLFWVVCVFSHSTLPASGMCKVYSTKKSTGTVQVFRLELEACSGLKVSRYQLHGLV